MHIKEISYGKTMNIGNFQSIRVEFKAELGEFDTPKGTLEKLKAEVEEVEVQVRIENPSKR